MFEQQYLSSDICAALLNVNISTTTYASAPLPSPMYWHLHPAEFHIRSCSNFSHDCLSPAPELSVPSYPARRNTRAVFSSPAYGRCEHWSTVLSAQLLVINPSQIWNIQLLPLKTYQVFSGGFSCFLGSIQTRLTPTHGRRFYFSLAPLRVIFVDHEILRVSCPVFT